MRLRTRLAVLVCKASGAVLRRLGRGGTNLPGKLALKIDKNILGELSRGVKVTVVTGTNGKTTTSRMIEQAFADAGLKYFSNKSGANLLTGIIAVFAQQSRSAGILSGQGLEQPLEVGFVERDAPVTAGEILITSGLDGKYPKGIPVATVDSVAPSDSTQFLAVTARPLVDVRRLEEVLLLEPSGINRPLRPSEPAPDFVGPPRPPKRER